MRGDHHVATYDAELAWRGYEWLCSGEKWIPGADGRPAVKIVLHREQWPEGVHKAQSAVVELAGLNPEC